MKTKRPVSKHKNKQTFEKSRCQEDARHSSNVSKRSRATRKVMVEPEEIVSINDTEDNASNLLSSSQQLEGIVIPTIDNTVQPFDFSGDWNWYSENDLEELTSDLNNVTEDKEQQTTDLNNMTEDKVQQTTDLNNMNEQNEQQTTDLNSTIESMDYNLNNILNTPQPVGINLAEIGDEHLSWDSDIEECSENDEDSNAQLSCESKTKSGKLDKSTLQILKLYAESPSTRPATGLSPCKVEYASSVRESLKFRWPLYYDHLWLPNFTTGGMNEEDGVVYSSDDFNSDSECFTTASRTLNSYFKDFDQGGYRKDNSDGGNRPSNDSNVTVDNILMISTNKWDKVTEIDARPLTSLAPTSLSHYSYPSPSSLCHSSPTHLTNPSPSPTRLTNPPPSPTPSIPISLSSTSILEPCSLSEVVVVSDVDEDDDNSDDTADNNCRSSTNDSVGDFGQEAMEVSTNSEELFPGYCPELVNSMHELLKKVDPNDRVHSDIKNTLQVNDLLIVLSLREWFNDQTINQYLQLVQTRSGGRVYSFSSFFYSTMVTHGGLLRLLRWTRNVDIFSMEKLIVPIHTKNHWRLVCIDLEAKTISLYDSFGLSSDTKCVIDMYNYLKAEHKDKKNIQLDHSQWTMLVVQSPAQTNTHDCGVFVCVNAERIARNVPLDYTQADTKVLRQRIAYELFNDHLLH